MIIDQFTAKIRKIISQVERFRGGEKVARHFGRGIRWERNAKGSVANHVEQQATAKLLTGASLKLPCKIAASIQPIGVGKLLESFLAIKKQKLNFARERRMTAEDSGQFQEQTRAGAAVVRPHKPNHVEHLGVVMRT